LLNKLVVCFRNPELFSVNWILHLEMNLVFEILGQAQIILIDAQGILVLAQDVQVSVMKFLWYLQMTPSPDFFPG
jgi:hypothetical protein